MTYLTFVFEVHQPLRLKHTPNSPEKFKDEELIDYFVNDGLNKLVFDRAAKRCYYPTTQILLEHVDTFKGQKREFKCAFNLSGVWLEQCERWHPDLLELFKQLAKSKRVEFLGSTYFHSLASLFKSHDEFIEQIKMQSECIRSLLGVKPKVFLNTEMIFNNLIAKTVEDLKFKAIFTEGVDRVLGWRSPNYVYARGPAGETDIPLRKRIKVLLRNYRLSDDIGYRFSAKHWDQWPLTAEKYAIWLAVTPGQVINICMDYETFGEHHHEESGIFFFLKALPWKIFDWQNLEFALPSEIARKIEAVDEFDVPGWSTISWADTERDVSAWLGNTMQKTAFEELEKLEKLVKQSNNPHFLRLWRILQMSDHLYYSCTKWWEDGDVHKYFSPFPDPHDSFVSIISALSEIKVRITKEMVRQELLAKMKKKRKIKKIKTRKLKPRKPRKIKTKLKKIKARKVEEKVAEEITKPIEILGPKTILDEIAKESVEYPAVSLSEGDLNKAMKLLEKKS
ncbi:MAG TPA: alpha-amylase [Candidatus Aenigmarchaeota archaeon]|nr:alpha-amylase [Candidatus Aenigmarchaeota archaeon]